DIPESEKVCPHDGTPLERIGEETSEQYDYTPPQLKVLRHERPKYSCPCCHQGLKIAPVPVQLLPKSMASPSMLAHITTAKFVDGVLPASVHDEWRDGLIMLCPHSFRVMGARHGKISGRDEDAATRVVADAATVG